MIALLQNKKWLAPLLAAVSAAALPWTLARTAGAAAPVHGVVCALGFALFYLLLRRAAKKLTGRLLAFSVCGGALLSLSLAVGRQVYVDGGFALTLVNLLWTCLLVAALLPAMTAALVLLLSDMPMWTDKLRALSMERSRLNPAYWKTATAFFVFFGVLLLCWLPAYLAYFPGIYGYDMHNQNHQALIGVYNNYQPVLHTLLYEGCYNLGLRLFGTGTGGVALFTAVQTLLLALSLSGVLTYLVRRLKAPFLVTLLALAWYAVLPFNAILAVSSTKDTVFSGVFLLALLQVYDLCMEPAACVKSWKRIALYLLTVLLCCLLRNNAIYAFLVLLPFLVLGVKEKRALVAALAVGAILLAVAGKGVLLRATGAGDGPRSEMLNVPIQQVARAYTLHEEALSEEEKQEIYRYLPEALLKEYNPLLSDPVKLDATIGDGLPSITGFLGVWAKLLPRYLNDYTDAFLISTAGWWYPPETLHSHVYDAADEPDTEETLGYMYTGFMEDINADVEKRSLWTGAEDYYQWFAHGNNHERIPVVSLLFAPGFYCWLLFFAVLLLLFYKQYRLLIPLALPYGVWLTLLLGPCVIVRYAYPLMACCPLLLGVFTNGTGAFTLREPEADTGAKDGRGAEVFRFAVAGGVGFVIDYGCMVLLKEAFGFHYLLATGLAFLVSVVVNYLLCAYWVFQGADTKDGGVKAGFLLTSVIGLGLNELIMLLLVDVVHVHYMLAKLVAVVLVMIWNYFSKRKVLVRKNKSAEAPK